MTPEVTAAERAAAQEIIREALGTNPAVLAVLEAKADSWVHRLIPAVATALATVRAEGADVVLERDELLAERYEAIEALTQHKALRARVTALEAALRTIERWNDFPPTGQQWEQSGNPISYGAAYGSNGERDYMRGIARKALAPGAGGTNG